MNRNVMLETGHNCERSYPAVVVSWNRNAGNRVETGVCVQTPSPWAFLRGSGGGITPRKNLETVYAKYWIKCIFWTENGLQCRP